MELQLLQGAAAKAVLEQLKSWARRLRAAHAAWLAQRRWLHVPICLKAGPEGRNSGLVASSGRIYCGILKP